MSCIWSYSTVLSYFLGVRLGGATIDSAIVGASPPRPYARPSRSSKKFPSTGQPWSLNPGLHNGKLFWTPFFQRILMLRRVRDFPLVSRDLGRFLISPPFLSRVRTDSGRVANHSPTTFNGLVPPSTVSNKVAQSRVGQRSLGAASFGTRNSRQNCLPCPVSSQGNHSHRRN